MMERSDRNQQVTSARVSNREHEEGPYVTPSRLARHWSVSLNTVYRDIRKGALPAFRVGSGKQFRIRMADARRYGRPVE